MNKEQIDKIIEDLIAIYLKHCREGEFEDAKATVGEIEIWVYKSQQLTTNKFIPFAGDIKNIL